VIHRDDIDQMPIQMQEGVDQEMQYAQGSTPANVARG
jgi:hypothetical protein